MGVLTPFGEVTLGDEISISRWAAAHAAKHQQYAAENIFATQFLVNSASNQPGAPPKPGSYVVRGNSGGGDLNEPIDGDWMARHTARHVSLATAAVKKAATAGTPENLIPPLSSADIKGLSLPDIWQTEAELQDWHELHNRTHTLIDRARQIAGVQAKPNTGNPHLPGSPPMPGRPGNIAPTPPHGPIP